MEKSEKTKAAALWIADNIISATAPAGLTDYGCVELLCGAAHRPIPIVHLSVKLKTHSLSRGRACFGAAGDVIEGLVFPHDRLEWWVTAAGLSISTQTPLTAVVDLSLFDQLAGSQVAEYWSKEHTGNHARLSQARLIEIAKNLDAAGFAIAMHIQPKQATELALHNQRSNRNPIKTFLAAVSSDRFVQIVRRRLYVARDRYIHALSTTKYPAPQRIPEVFFSHPVF